MHKQNDCDGLNAHEPMQTTWFLCSSRPQFHLTSQKKNSESKDIRKSEENKYRQQNHTSCCAVNEWKTLRQWSVHGPIHLHSFAKPCRNYIFRVCFWWTNERTDDALRNKERRAIKIEHTSIDMNIIYHMCVILVELKMVKKHKIQFNIVFKVLRLMCAVCAQHMMAQKTAHKELFNWTSSSYSIHRIYEYSIVVRTIFFVRSVLTVYANFNQRTNCFQSHAHAAIHTQPTWARAKRCVRFFFVFAGAEHTQQTAREQSLLSGVCLWVCAVQWP